MNNNTSSHRLNVAVVVPCFNEEGAVEHLVEAIRIQREKISDSYVIDIILVNDGSTDATQREVVQLSNKYSYLYYREFSHNAGHQFALRAGLSVSGEYDYVIMMDADMQHPPELIPVMLKKASETGASIVQMVRVDSYKDVGVLRYLASWFYYKLINVLSGLNMDYGSSDFRLVDKQVIRALIDSRETNLFLRGYFSWLNVKREIIPYKPNARIAGSSKYTLRKLLNFAGEGIVQFSEKPLYIAIKIGLLTSVASLLYGLFLVWDRFLGEGALISGWTTIVVIILFCFGLNFILIGFIGLYLAQALRLQKSRPGYFIATEKLPHA